MKLKKFNLAEFEVAKLKVNELLIAKGGSGSSQTNCSLCASSFTDNDSNSCDRDY